MNLGPLLNQIARQQVANLGAPVEFTFSGPGDYDASTDTWTAPTVEMVRGHAIRTRGRPQTYERLSLRESEAPTLFFTPNTYGEMPTPDMVTELGGKSYTVKDVEPIAPDGKAIAARVVVVRGGGS